MDDYQNLYRQAFETLGRRLKTEDVVPEAEILAAERRLGLRIPKALADFYRSAGMADDYNSIFDRLLPPGELSVESGKLLFMEENQAVVLWGTDAGAEPTDDPPAYQATNAEPLVWENVNDRCSVFLLVMLHWAGAFAGAMPNASTAAVDGNLLEELDRHWPFVGEVDGLRAYSRAGKAVCFLRWEDEWRIFAGATSEEGMNAIAADLGVTWESPLC
jgi:hypothetical protein